MQRNENIPGESNLPETDLWRRVLLVSDLLRSVVKKGADSERLSRITVNQARIFGYIFSRKHQGDIRISRLAHDLDVTPAAAGQAVERLVKSGLVDRRTDPTDRRAFVISVSDKGRQHIREYEERACAVTDAILAGLPRDEVDAFLRVLDAVHEGLRDRWEAILAERRAAP